MAYVERLRWMWMIAAAAVLLVSASAWPQAKGGNTTLHTTTRLVNVSVVVTDTQGNPVKDLIREDFAVLDGGQAQKIAFFSAVDNELTLRSVSRPSPDTFTNRLPEHGATASVTVLLFDTLNSRWTSQGFGLHRIRKFLRHIEPQDHIGIYVLGDELKAVHDLGPDSSDLVEAIRRYDEEHSHDLAKPTARSEESTGNVILDRFLSGKDNRYRFEMDG
ncbi:MAG: VWA domain-containing protein, partial [Candidatus Acidiferrum sp.]